MEIFLCNRFFSLFYPIFLFLYERQSEALYMLPVSTANRIVIVKRTLSVVSSFLKNIYLSFAFVRKDGKAG